MYLHDADWQPEFFWAELVLEVPIRNSQSAN